MLGFTTSARLAFFILAGAAFIAALLPADYRAAEALIDTRHLAAFAALAMLAAFAWPGSWTFTGAGLLLFGAAIELAQLAPALNRNASLSDLVADLAGILAGYGLAAMLQTRLALPDEGAVRAS